MKHSHRATRTWNGGRWACVLLAVVFGGIAGWLGLHEHLLHSAAAGLIAIPATFSVCGLITAAFASDERIRQFASLFLSLG